VSSIPPPAKHVPDPIEAVTEPSKPPLEWLIHPITKERFFQEYWERKPLVIQREYAEYYRSLLSLDDVDRVLTTLDLRYPNVVLKNAARDVSSEDYTVHGGSLDVAKVYQLFAEGSTVTLAYLHTALPALTTFCRGLEAEFSHPFQANVYLTPPRSQGAKAHYDTHDVFVLQVTGSKGWTVLGTPVELPLRNQDFDPSQHNVGSPTLEFELCAGDAAYIPRGWVHEARSSDNVSLHVTVGVLAYTWTDFLLECVADACLNDAAFRESLPPGFARKEFPRERARAVFGRLLQHLSERSAPEKVLDRFTDELLSSCPPLLRGQLAQLAALDQLATDSIVGTRPHLLARVETSANAISVRCFGRRITFPRAVAPAVQFALICDRFVVRDLPGDLDAAGKLTLVRRLILEGLLVAHTTN
jgi:ribosomal protein L16 Arg81 hydroxylase